MDDKIGYIYLWIMAENNIPRSCMAPNRCDGHAYPCSYSGALRWLVSGTLIYLHIDNIVFLCVAQEALGRAIFRWQVLWSHSVRWRDHTAHPRSTEQPLRNRHGAADEGAGSTISNKQVTSAEFLDWTVKTNNQNQQSNIWPSVLCKFYHSSNAHFVVYLIVVLDCLCVSIVKSTHSSKSPHI